MPDAPAYRFIAEVYAQPAAATATLAAEGALADGLGYALAHRADRITLVGCGDPYFLGYGAASAFRQWARLPAEAAEGLDFCLEGATAIGGRDVVIAVSQSGRTVQAVQAARLARQRGAFTLAVTNTPGSPLTEMVDGVLHLHGGPSLSFPTQTTTAALALLYRLALSLGRARGAISDDDALRLHTTLDSIAEPMRAALALNESMRDLADGWRDKAHFSFLGVGPGYATALQGEAKLKETSQTRAEAHQLEEFAHLHIFALRQGDPLVVIAPSERSGARARDIVRVAADYGAEVVAIVAQADTAAWAEVPAQLIATPDVPDVLSPLVQVIPLQLFAYHLAAAKGRNPDRPMGFDNATLQRLVYAAQLPGWDAP